VPAFDGGDNFVGVSGPGKGLRVGIVFGEEAIDGFLQIADGAEDAAFRPASGELGKEALNGVEP